MDTLHAVDWASLTHAYGRAAGLPDTLRRVASGDPRQAEQALYDLHGTIYHQGWVYPATAPAVAVLYGLVADPQVHHRTGILALLSDIACAVWDLEEHCAEEYDEPSLETVTAWARAARDAVEAGIPTLIDLLDDADPAVRAAAPFVLADFADFADRHFDLVPLLRGKAEADDDPAAAASMVLAIGDLCADMEDPPLDWLIGLTSEPAAPADARAMTDAGTAGDREGRPHRAVRVAAAIAALWCGAGDLAEDTLKAITDEIQAPESALDGQLWVEEGGRTGFLTDALGDHPAVQIRMAGDALRTADPAGRLVAVHRAGQVMRSWRAGPAELLPALADLLADLLADAQGEEDSEIVEAAVWEIKQGGPQIALVADPLARTLDADPDESIAGSALEALARVGDARCLPALIADLAEPRLAFNPAPAIGGMSAHADRLLEPVRAFLEEPKRGTGFAGNHLANLVLGLRAWAPEHTLALLPQLVSVLERRKAIAAVALTIGGLGAVAGAAVPVLRGHLGRKHGRPARESAAWALWQITGDGEETLRVLGSGLRSGLDDEATLRLYDLGPRAAAVVPLIEPLLDDDRSAAAAAVVIYRATGDMERALPHLVGAVAATPVGMLAVRCLGEIGPAAAEAAPAIERIVESERVLAGGSSTDAIATDLAYRELAAAAVERIRSAGAGLGYLQDPIFATYANRVLP